MAIVLYYMDPDLKKIKKKNTHETSGNVTDDPTANMMSLSSSDI